MKIIRDYPVFVKLIPPFMLGDIAAARSICLNDYNLLQFLKNKAIMREFASQYIPVVPYVEFNGNSVPDVGFDVSEEDAYILQKVFSSGGNGTFKMSRSRCVQYFAENKENEHYILSPFLRNAVSLNVHAVVFDNSCIVLPPSFQLIQHNGEAFLYIGGDFFVNLSNQQFELIQSRTLLLAEALREAGYRGVCGVDYLLTENELYFLELNPRFQASSFLANKLLINEGKPSLIDLNLRAFSGEPAPIDSFTRFKNPESFFTVNGSVIPEWLFCSPPASIILEMIPDGFSAEMRCEDNAYLFRVISKRNLSWLDPDYRLHVAPNIQADSHDWKEKIINRDALVIKIGLLNQGIRFSPSAEIRMMRDGIAARQGVFQSIDLRLENGLIVNAPYHTDFSELSPYCIDHRGKSSDQYILKYNGQELCNVAFDETDPYRKRVASHGTLYRNVTFWATDRLRVHHQFHCYFKEKGLGCGFCNVRFKEGPFLIDDVCEAIDFYLDHTDFRHFLIGGGSGNESDEHENILKLATHIRSRSNKPIYAMCLPPENTTILKDYYNAGINEIGFNLEIFDRKIAQTIMPGKGNIPLSRYEKAYIEAVRLWGDGGNVRSLMVLGLEREESFFKGIEWLSRLGVMPIISVFRPLNNIALNNVLPPDNEDLEAIFHRAAEITAKRHLIPGPLCTACQNNTLSLPISKMAWGKNLPA